MIDQVINMSLYALLAGRAGGQTLTGGTQAGEQLTLRDNSVDNGTVDTADLINAFEHISSDGADHSFIDQDLTISASPTFAGLTVEGVATIEGIGDGGRTNYDLKVGDVDGTPTYGMIQFGNAVIGRTSFNVGNIDLDGAVIVQNIGGPITSEIEFLWTESAGDSCRFALPRSAVGNATYNSRSMLLAGPAPADTDFVKVTYWQGQGIFDNLTCDTSGTGADLGVQNNLEVEGTIYVDTILESTVDASITLGTTGNTITFGITDTNMRWCNRGEVLGITNAGVGQTLIELAPEANADDDQSVGFQLIGNATDYPDITANHRLFVGWLQAQGKYVFNSFATGLSVQDMAFRMGSTDAINIIGTTGTPPGATQGDVLIPNGNFTVTTGDIIIDSDSKGVTFGEAQDATIQYSGTNLTINSRVVGSGDVVFPSPIFVAGQSSQDEFSQFGPSPTLQSPGNSADMLVAIKRVTGGQAKRAMMGTIEILDANNAAAKAAGGNFFSHFLGSNSLTSTTTFGGMTGGRYGLRFQPNVAGLTTSLCTGTSTFFTMTSGSDAHTITEFIHHQSERPTLRANTEVKRHFGFVSRNLAAAGTHGDEIGFYAEEPTTADTVNAAFAAGGAGKIVFDYTPGAPSAVPTEFINSPSAGILKYYANTNHDFSMDGNEKIRLTAIGGFAIKLTNKTGANTVAGQLVKADTATDDGVILTAAGDDECFGVFLDSGVADDAEAWVVVAGIADVAMEDDTAATHGNWVETSDAEAGYADATTTTPPAAPSHFEEIGHCIETVAAGGGGTHILARCVLHFN